ncbi:hypothetical protein JDN40_04200 [Rhodomicrobium vannielii ATCC 17100]|uniref:hypothetical protein n=1 Tax=Rhodomicrobium vannielii TaxID=1069 RepID=UPI0019196524|nr:hypothetical protein [Rhodomicrobium vannielii]MBJ7533309.1 hypothetical protein [Rhodomicrobium vannielii ATCC 17100]
MKLTLKTTLGSVGAVVAVGFLLASAVMNYLFGSLLGRTPIEAKVYGAVSVLAVLCNALSPFFLSWAREGKRHAVAIAVGILWALCLTYSITSALGFAAENRTTLAGARQTIQSDYESAARRLAEFEATRATYTRPPRDLEDRIDRLRQEMSELRKQGGMVEADPQGQLLSKLTFGVIEKDTVRFLLVALFAVMVEAGAALGLFAALAHMSAGSEKPVAKKSAKAKVTKPTPKAVTPPARWLPASQRKKIE